MLYGCVAVLLIVLTLFLLYKKCRLEVSLSAEPKIQQKRVYIQIVYSTRIQLGPIRYYKKRTQALLPISRPKPKRKRSIRWLLWTPHLERLRVSLYYGLEGEPAATALLYGVLYALVYGFVPPFLKPEDRHKFKFDAFPDFNNSRICIHAYCIVNLKIANIISEYIKEKRRNKK